jgi:hypothetical protein
MSIPQKSIPQTSIPQNDNSPNLWGTLFCKQNTNFFLQNASIKAFLTIRLKKISILLTKKSSPKVWGIVVLGN